MTVDISMLNDSGDKWIETVNKITESNDDLKVDRVVSGQSSLFDTIGFSVFVK